MILASTIVQVGEIKNDQLNKIIRPLLSTLKNEKISRKYQKMASKALVKLISSDEISIKAKEKIVRCTINYIELDPEPTDQLVSIVNGRPIRFYDEQFDRISSFTGVSAFFYSYSKVFGYENILTANEDLILKIIKGEYNTLPVASKSALVYNENNEFYQFLLKIRIMMHILRDLNSTLKINGIEDVLKLVASQVEVSLENDTNCILRFAYSEADDADPCCLSQLQAKYLTMVSRILGEALAKNLINRKYLLELLFKLIEVDQIDTVYKEIGRGIIDVALQFAEDDDSVDFFKYLPCFIIPVLKNSSSIKGFSIIMARLFKLLPLNQAGVFDREVDGEDGFNPSAEYEQGFEFLKVLSNKRSSNKDRILKGLNAKEAIREYQEHGISWIVSLTDFGFNCALCDDMGLGKTFQALAAISIKVSERRTSKNKHNTISLVICPSTLVHNWNNEIRKFFNPSDLKGDVYEESAKGCDYKYLKNQVIPKNDILIISYDKIRAHVEFFQKFKFLYIVLDEAHLIKNAKSQTTMAIKSLNAERKLILTGTPLQNRVTELWSIFDFLMPGFLEEEAIFNRKYTKYLSTTLKKVGENEKETEQFLMSIQSLRERISPFILRRTKENVMKELPPKIIQDYRSPLTECQTYLHEILEKLFPYTEGMKSIDTKASNVTANKNAIENLLAHRRLCNHPDFILEDNKIMKCILDEIDEDVFNERIDRAKGNQELYEQSGKLISLISLLEE